MDELDLISCHFVRPSSTKDYVPTFIQIHFPDQSSAHQRLEGILIFSSFTVWVTTYTEESNKNKNKSFIGDFVGIL